MMFRLAAALGALMFVVGAAQARPDTIYVMRHLERDAGADPRLNATGQANSERLAAWFRREKPVAIFVTPYKRARETAAPLAARLRLVPRDYDPRAPERMIEAVRAEKGPVLVVGHSNTVPAIVHALGGPEAPDLADNDYGRIWIVRKQGRSVAVARLAEPQPR